MNVACPACDAVYRIDPQRVPAEGAVTRCRECEALFRLGPGTSDAAGAITTAEPVAAASTTGPADVAMARAVEDVAEPYAPAAEPEQPQAPPLVFGVQDPQTRARRLARALVSDIKVYNPDKWEECRAQGTMRAEFRDEILKSWDEYVEQVGETMAKRTPFFRDALNEILAAGEPVF